MMKENRTSVRTKIAAKHRLKLTETLEQLEKDTSKTHPPPFLVLIPIIVYDPRSQKTLNKVRLEIYCHCPIEDLDNSGKYVNKIRIKVKTDRLNSLPIRIMIQQANNIKIICGVFLRIF